MTNEVEERPASGPVTLEQLAALNDEIVALSRAGLPLERGLLDAGRDLPGRLREVMTGVAARMERGETLAQAIEAQGDRLPTIYRAVVEAGLRGGRLPEALESLASFVRGYLDARRSIGLALWYPLIVLTVAYALLLFLTTTIAPVIFRGFHSLGLPENAAVRGLEWLGTMVPYWGPVLPALLALGLVWWVGSGRGGGFRPGRSWSLIRLFPWMDRLVRQFEAANFADLLALLVEQGVAYPQAVALAAGATGDPRLVRTCRALAEALERGEAPGRALAETGARGLPPLLRWLLAAGAQQERLASSLREAGAIYRARSIRQAEKIQAFLPTVLLLAIGGTATALFGLSLFYPFASMLRALAVPTD